MSEDAKMWRGLVWRLGIGGGIGFVYGRLLLLLPPHVTFGVELGSVAGLLWALWVVGRDIRRGRKETEELIRHLQGFRDDMRRVQRHIVN